jgi:hypothetical protein
VNKEKGILRKVCAAVKIERKENKKRKRKERQKLYFLFFGRRIFLSGKKERNL